MKITILAANTKKPLANTQVQLQIRGKDGGFHSFQTDASGQIQLDEKYKEQQNDAAGEQGDDGLHERHGAEQPRL